MANSFKHSSVGTELTQTEWEAIDGHVIESQAIGDILYAESTASLQRLGIGSTGDYLRVDNGRPDWQATTSITALGTIATGVWQGTDVGVAYGGTGVSTLTANGVLIGNGASAIASVDMSTKGHVLIGDGSGNPQMLSVGTNNHVLTADSGETTGVKWAAPAAAAAGSLTGSTLASGVVTTSVTTVGALGAGSITSGFGAIDIGSDNLTATGTISLGGTSFSGAVDIQGGYANSGGAPYDGVVDVGGGGNWATIQAGDDALDAGDYTMLVKGGTYTAGVTVSTGEARIVVEPGTVIQGAIVLSGDDVTLELGAGCDVQSTVTLSGNNCSLICQNGVDLDGIIVSGNFGYVNGGGWDTLSHGGSANDGISVSGTDTIVQNISAQTSGGGYDACESSGERTTFDKIKVVGADRFGFLASADEVKILNSVIADSGSENIFSNSTEGLIAYNYCNSAGLDGIECDDSGDNSVIIGNTVRDQASDSIELSAACENCVVVGNRTDGAIADNSGTSTVTGNDETAF